MLAVFAIFPSSPILAQTGATTITNGAPNPLVMEAQRRVTLSRRRREQIALNAQNSQALMASQESPVANTPTRRQHRVLSMHRGATAQELRALRAATSSGVSE